MSTVIPGIRSSHLKRLSCRNSSECDGFKSPARKILFNLPGPDVVMSAPLFASPCSITLHYVAQMRHEQVHWWLMTRKTDLQLWDTAVIVSRILTSKRAWNNIAQAQTGTAQTSDWMQLHHQNLGNWEFDLVIHTGSFSRNCVGDWWMTFRHCKTTTLYYGHTPRKLWWCTKDEAVMLTLYVDTRLLFPCPHLHMNPPIKSSSTLTVSITTVLLSLLVK